MKTLIHVLRKAKPAAIARARENNLVRTFVETGDERCPLAGIWMRLSESTNPTDDPEIRLPALGDYFWWRAFHLRFTALQYSTS